MPERTPGEVGAVVRARRLELGLTPSEVIAAADVDPKTYMSLEDGARWPQERSRLKIEAALRWQSGSTEQIRQGGDPIPLSPDTTTQKPLRPDGQTTAVYSRAGTLADLIAATESTASALEELNVIFQSRDGSGVDPDGIPGQENLVKARESLSGTVGLTVIACEILGEKLAAEDIRNGETVGDLAVRLDSHAIDLDKIRTIAHRLNNALSDGGNHDLETKTEQNASSEVNKDEEVMSDDAPKDRLPIGPLVTGGMPLTDEHLRKRQT